MKVIYIFFLTALLSCTEKQANNSFAETKLALLQSQVNILQAKVDSLITVLNEKQIKEPPKKIKKAKLKNKQVLSAPDSSAQTKDLNGNN